MISINLHTDHSTVAEYKHHGSFCLLTIKQGDSEFDIFMSVNAAPAAERIAAEFNAAMGTEPAHQPAEAEAAE